MRMSTTTFRKLTGFIFILTPLWLFVNFRVLGSLSGFPDIQFAGVEALLTKVYQSGTAAIIAWYVYLIPGALYIAAASFWWLLKTEGNVFDKRPGRTAGV